MFLKQRSSVGRLRTLNKHLFISSTAVLMCYPSPANHTSFNSSLPQQHASTVSFKTDIYLMPYFTEQKHTERDGYLHYIEKADSKSSLMTAI